ncbi:hypothetical protein Bbelb_160580 [Branchiostoma belcheri]|nr:hypothetical protein Bbelb_160580 [Branchiostoma belcheri]
MGVLTVIILPVLLTVVAAEAGKLGAAEAGKLGAAEAGKLGAAEAGQGATEAGKLETAEAGKLGAAEAGQGPRRLASWGPRGLASWGPRRLASWGPRRLANWGPRRLASWGPRRPRKAKNRQKNRPCLTSPTPLRQCGVKESPTTKVGQKDYFNKCRTEVLLEQRYREPFVPPISMNGNELPENESLRLLEQIMDSEAPQGALKRHPDDLRQLSATVQALQRDQDALKRDQDALKRNQDALKRDQHDMRRLSTTVDDLKRDQHDMRRLSTIVDDLKRDQHDMRRLPTIVDALKRNYHDIRRLSTTVDALKRELDNEKRRHKIGQTLKSCPRGYTMWRGTCYKAFNKRKSFDKAAAACRADGGTLAMPRDAGTDAFLISLYKSVSDHWNFWIGLHDQREEGRFEWVDGSALGPYSSWSLGEPNNFFGMQDCVCYSAKPSEKDKWDDQPCFMLYYFICQAAPGRP